MKYEYECWKCPEWHETTGLSAIRFAKMRVTVGRLKITLPNYSALYQHQWWKANGAVGLFGHYYGRCTECHRITKQKNLWRAEPGAAWCQRCQ